MESLHPDLFHATGRSEMQAAITTLEAAVPGATDDELMVGVLRIVALVSAAGRDGHTGAFIWGTGRYPAHSLPMRLWLFPDGLHVVDALPPYTAHVGDLVATIAGRPTAEVLALIAPLVPRDNLETVALVTPRFVLIPEVLHGLGLVGDASAVELGLVAMDGTATRLTVEPIAMADYNAWAGPYGLHLPARSGSRFLARMEEPLWFEVIGHSRTLYVQYNRVDGVSEAAIEALRAALARPQVRHVVVDLRHNYGGETRAIRPVLDALESITPGKGVSVIIGRNTFSAAALVATELERTLDPVFIGEPMGGSPNFFANSRDVLLPASGIALSVSTEWYVGSTTDDARLELVPDVAAPLNAADYIADADPALAAAMAVP